jgi:hypothetical protein
MRKLQRCERRVSCRAAPSGKLSRLGHVREKSKRPGEYDTIGRFGLAARRWKTEIDVAATRETACDRPVIRRRLILVVARKLYGKSREEALPGIHLESTLEFKPRRALYFSSSYYCTDAPDALLRAVTPSDPEAPAISRSVRTSGRDSVTLASDVPTPFSRLPSSRPLLFLSLHHIRPPRRPGPLNLLTANILLDHGLARSFPATLGGPKSVRNIWATGTPSPNLWGAP